jgi:hypothetical protein
MRLAYTSGCGSRASRSHRSEISAGVFLDVAPFPPRAKSPSSPLMRASPSFKAPVTVVVTPLGCQSNPRTHPKAWNPEGIRKTAQQLLGSLVYHDVNGDFTG